MVNHLYLTCLVRARFFFKNSGLIWDTWNSLEDPYQLEALKPFWKIISWIFDESTVLFFCFFFPRSQKLKKNSIAQIPPTRSIIFIVRTTTVVTITITIQLHGLFGLFMAAP